MTFVALRRPTSIVVNVTLCEIALKDGRVEQGNFNTYQVIRTSGAPAIEVYIVSNTEASGGIGVPETCAIVPAIANAAFAATTGNRLRKLPLNIALLEST